MNPALGRNGLIGLAVGAAAGLGLMAFIIYRELTQRTRGRSRTRSGPEARRPGLLLGSTLDEHELDAQLQALAAVEEVVQGLSPEQQLELRNQLDQVLTCVSSLRSEVAELRGGLQDIAVQIIQDIKKGVEDSHRVRRRRHLIHRERTDSTSSSSIYFTASQGLASAFEEASEGGYSTAYAESDYTDRDTDKEGEREPEQESDEEEDKSCATVVTLKLEEEEERGLEDEGDRKEEEINGTGQQQTEQLVKQHPSGEMALLLAQCDILHTGDASLKAEGYRLLLDNKDKYEHSEEFLWRLARAYRDMYESAGDKQEKIVYGQLGREEAEKALKKNGLSAECHRWFAMLTGLTTQHEGLHGKLKSTHIFKAEKLRPGFCRNVRLYIAKCYKELNNLYEATHWTQLAREMSTNSEDDAETAELEAQLQHLTD
ncbi:regulator of microtubule dynamics protein 3 isoform X2 [Gouania willdenowi]|uniref:regulator of microtubule dynamics protein 3 isoform X2 n=1 Tax=Gouania willdenowi TaxID=441366 RepID=UPI001055127E|nr:regulator of microtubule dynamics protein 3-like isoform X2 [Gouania willdenowi]